MLSKPHCLYFQLKKKKKADRSIIFSCRKKKMKKRAGVWGNPPQNLPGFLLPPSGPFASLQETGKKEQGETGEMFKEKERGFCVFVYQETSAFRSSPASHPGTGLSAAGPASPTAPLQGESPAFRRMRVSPSVPHSGLLKIPCGEEESLEMGKIPWVVLLARFLMLFLGMP